MQRWLIAFQILIYYVIEFHICLQIIIWMKLLILSVPVLCSLCPMLLLKDWLRFEFMVYMHTRIGKEFEKLKSTTERSVYQLGTGLCVSWQKGMPIEYYIFIAWLNNLFSITGTMTAWKKEISAVLWLFKVKLGSRINARISEGDIYNCT